jgi:hypothetical protein
MRRAVVCGGLLALAFTSARLEAADTSAGGAALTPAEAKGLARCETTKVATVDVPEQCGVRFEIARFGSEESGFVMQYTKPPQWLTDGSQTGVFWPPPDSKYHPYPQQTAGAFQPRPNGPFQVRVIGLLRWEADGERPVKELLIGKKGNLFCMARVNRVTSEDRVVLNFFAGPDDPRPNAIVQAIYDSGSPGQKCSK